MVTQTGATAVNVKANANNGYVGCHPDHDLPCYRTELPCSVTLSDSTMASGIPRILIRSTGIPDHNSHALTGQVSNIGEQNHIFRIPQVPQLLALSEATSANQGPIGYAVNGVPIFGPYNSGCCDATFEEIRSMDYCLGHPANGLYHYHYFSQNTQGATDCLMSCAAGEVSDIVGVAKDGFPIYGPMQYYSAPEGKVYIDPSNCDNCRLRQLMVGFNVFPSSSKFSNLSAFPIFFKFRQFFGF